MICQDDWEDMSNMNEASTIDLPQQLPIRAAVTASADYPFTRIDAAIKLDQNESAEDFPADLKALALQRMMAQPWNRYPDLNADSLRDAIAAYENWPADGIVVTTGSNVLIALLTQLAGIGRRVVTVAPNFALYALSARLLDVDLAEVALREDFSLDGDAVIEAIKNDNSGILYLPQPHAPTGTLAAQQDLHRILQASANWMTVIDEAYYQFSDTDSKSLARQFPNTVLLRTFSKAWGLAGLRLGYALTTPEIARQLQKLVPPFAVSAMQTVVAQVALENSGYVVERVKQVIRERERVIETLRTHPTWQAYPSAANFVLIRTPNAAQAFEQLLGRGVLVRRQDSQPGLTGCIRVTIGTAAENDTFLRAAFLSGNGSPPASQGLR